MPGYCATFARAAERQFNEKKAAEELARYRKNGPLLDAAISHAEQCFALSYPRDAWYVRLGLALENRRRRVSGNTFRTFVHPVADMEQTITRAGFERSSRPRRGCGQSMCIDARTVTEWQPLRNVKLSKRDKRSEENACPSDQCRRAGRCLSPRRLFF
jgi:hypothetical protein